MKPILFNTEMVRAILDGRKTTTRRIIKLPSYVKAEENGLYTLFADGTVYENQRFEEITNYINPTYHPGDVLYVRETFAVGHIACGEEPDGTAEEYISQCIGENDIIPKEYAIRHNIGIEDVVWKPSIFMPKEAARIFLRVTGVKVTHLKNITEEGAKAEGIPTDWPMDPVYCPTCRGEGLIGTLHPVSLGYMEVDCPDCEKATKRFENLWNSTIKKADRDKFGWNANPRVWVISFERCEKPGDGS